MFGLIPKLVEVITETTVKAVTEIVEMPAKVIEAAAEGIEKGLEGEDDGLAHDGADRGPP